MLSSKCLCLKRQGWNTSPHPWHRKGSRCRLEPSLSARCRVLCLTSSSRNSQPSQRCSAEICQGSTERKWNHAGASFHHPIMPANLERETLQRVLLAVQRTALLGLLWDHGVWNLQTKNSNPGKCWFLTCRWPPGGEGGGTGQTVAGREWLNIVWVGWEYKFWLYVFTIFADWPISIICRCGDKSSTSIRAIVAPLQVHLN